MIIRAEPLTVAPIDYQFGNRVRIIVRHNEMQLAANATRGRALYFQVPFEDLLKTRQRMFLFHSRRQKSIKPARQPAVNASKGLRALPEH